MASDAQVAQARPGLPRQWCREYKVHLTSSLSIAKYSELGASRLALEFCRKCQHFYDIWLASDAVNFKFGADQLASYVEQPGVFEFPHPAPVETLILGRLDKIRHMVPTNPA